MKKAKIILTSVAILALIGGTFAFKVSRFQPKNIWYIPAIAPTIESSTIAGGFIYYTTIPNCTLSNQATTNIGIQVLTSTSSTDPAVTTVFTRAVGVQTVSFTTTYHFCTPVLTKTTLADI